MFTGLIEEIGEIKSIKSESSGKTFEIFAKHIIEEVKIGDSVSVNGVCLTVCKKNKDKFFANAMFESIKKTNLKSLRINQKVNLERAMKMSDRFDGHIVTGHVEEEGQILKIKKIGIASVFTIKSSKNILDQIIFKGSITLDGVSLTILEKNTNSFSVSIIPHTIKNTIFKEKKRGDFVNIEIDFFSKYIKHYLYLKESIK